MASNTFCLLAVLLAYVALSLGAPASEEMMSDDDAMTYIMAYGYGGPSSPDETVGALVDTNPREALRVGLEIFQHRYGLEVTGRMDAATSALMKMSRCGNKDILSKDDMSMSGVSGRRKRYLAQGNPWPRTDLTYSILQYPRDNDMSNSDVDTEIRRAFQVWSDVTPLTFTRISGSRADILIRFEAYEHGDGNAFDGQGGVLAHAFLPFSGAAIEGDTHFDESETWTLYTYAGTNLFQVAAHEFGHALGLGHSEDQSALMAPFYRGYIPDFRLPMDDILGIQSLYGTGTDRGDMTTPRTGGSLTFPPGMPNFCEDPEMDAVTYSMEDGVEKLLFFQGGYYAALGSNGIASGYPRSISSDWPGLPDNIDAALYLEGYTRSYWQWSWETYSYTRQTETSPDYTLFFRGDRYYQYTDDRTAVSTGRPMSELGLPSDIDAAFVWARNGRVYVFKGSEYYRLTINTNGGALLSADSGYPLPLSHWRLGIERVDAAVKTTGGNNYFFHDGLFYLFDNSNVQVADGYPALLSNVFGCQNNIESETESEGYGVSIEDDDDMKSGADAQGFAYVTFMSLNCVMVLLVLCLV